MKLQKYFLLTHQWYSLYYSLQGYTDEPIGKILSNIANSDTVLLDRWNLKVEPNPDASDSSDGKDSLPLSVVNNYFSLGVDAHIALEFHEARGKRWLNCVIRIAEKFNYLGNLFHHHHNSFFFFLLLFLLLLIRAIYTPTITG